MTTQTTRICTVTFASEMSGTTRINVDQVQTRRGRRFRVATPALPGIDEMGFCRWAGSREEAREAFKTVRAQLNQLGYHA